LNLSALFIRRPVATILLSLALTLAGLSAYRQLPVAALPQVDFPTVSVSAQLPGASPETMANAVATPLIKQFSTIPAIQQISTTNAQGSTSITIEFDLDRDIDQAAADVQAAIARTQRQLPVEMTTPPSYRKLNPADAPILLLGLTSDTTPLPRLDAFVQQVISPALSTINGVGQVQVFGSQKYAVRVQLDPDTLAARGIGADEIEAATGAANANTPVGTVQGPTQNLTIEAETQLADAAAFRDLIVATRDGHPVRLGDLARVIDSVENTQQASAYDGQRSLVLAVQRQPGANTVEVVDKVKEMLPRFDAELGPTASLHVLNDRSASVRAAVHDVQLTLLLTVGLVVLVIYLFLGRLAATLIPSVAVPVSIIATFGAMHLLGYSIDNI
jgi:HAE1 family hydrophobic/amphiphilic exporter-1